MNQAQIRNLTADEAIAAGVATSEHLQEWLDNHTGTLEQRYQDGFEDGFEDGVEVGIEKTRDDAHQEYLDGLVVCTAGTIGVVDTGDPTDQEVI